MAELLFAEAVAIYIRHTGLTFEEASDAILAAVERGDIGYTNDITATFPGGEVIITQVGSSPSTTSELDIASFVHFLERRKRLLTGEFDEYRTKEKSELLHAPAPAEEIENVEPRTHNKRDTEARHASWQEEIDKLHADPDHRQASHAELCRQLATKLSVNKQTIRRNTTLRKP